MVKKEQCAFGIDGKLYSRYLVKPLTEPRDSEVPGHREPAVARERRYSMHGLYIGVPRAIKLANMFYRRFPR